MRRTLIAAFILFGTMALATAQKVNPQKSQTPEAMLGNAIYLEEVEHNLEGAIASYQRFLAQYGKNRGLAQLAAMAQLRLAMSYEKLSNSEARNAYERVVSDYKDQPKIVASARERLIALDHQPGNRRVCPDCGDSFGSLTPDGRFMTFTDDTGDIAIRDMATGRVHSLMALRGDSSESGYWATLSPDLTKVLFLCDAEDGELRVMANKPGSKSRVVLRLDDEINWIDPGGWFPDGQSILARVAKSDLTWQLARVRVTDGSVQVIKSLEWRLQGVRGNPSLSPDGKYIAYAALATNPSKPSPFALQSAPDSKDQYIYVLPADGSGKETVVAKSSGINDSPVWTPDGTHILFVSDRIANNRSGDFGLWSVEVRNGSASGSLTPIMEGIGKITPVGITRSGSYFYVREVGSEGIFIANLPGKGGKIGEARRLSDDFTRSRQPAWSPDGKFIAFTRHHPASIDSKDFALSVDLVVHDQTSGKETVYPVAPLFEPPIWFHNSKSILMLGAKLFRADLGRPGFRPAEGLMYSVPPGLGNLVLSPDDDALYGIVGKLDISTGSDPKELPAIYKAPATFSIEKFEFTTGKQKRIWTSSGPANEVSIRSLALSPDGRTLAMNRGNKSLMLVATDGTNPHELFSFSTASPGALAWAKDGRSILFWMFDIQTRDSQLMRIPLQGGMPESLGHIGITVSSFDLSPDGSQIVFSENAQRSELWSFDNVSSLWKAAR